MIITIHIGSLFAGLILGLSLGSFVLLAISLDERWSNGFGAGWKAGKESAEKKLSEGKEDENIPKGTL